jgi:predicted small lipoprotein YifL
VKLRYSTVIAVVFVILIVSAGCGKKTPPKAPPTAFSPTVSQLSVTLEGEDVVLSGRVYGKKSDLGDVSGCVIYHAWYPPREEPCETCPVDYRRFDTIRGSVTGPEGFLCRVPWVGDPGVHFFRVSLLGAGDSAGPLSPGVSISVNHRE